MEGPIPTCVGQPEVEGTEQDSESAYPHVCGATPPDPVLTCRNRGLSPRVWGNPSEG